MKLYTKTGDKGLTSLASGQRVKKDDIRLETYGTADELNSFVGLLRAKSDDQYQEQLEWIQNKLFNLGATLAGAPGDDWITNNDVHYLEQAIDNLQANQEPLREFVLPAGSENIALAHVCRTVTRRLERRIVSLSHQENENEDLYHTILQFVNRLSDFWFILALNLAKIEKKAFFLWKK